MIQTDLPKYCRFGTEPAAAGTEQQNPSARRGVLKTIGLAVHRRFAGKLPVNSAAKQVGNYGEEAVLRELRRQLPGALIYRSICLDEEMAKGEIDFLVIYQWKVFIVELKTWSGMLYEEGGTFHQVKTTSHGNTYAKDMRSPFAQIKRNTWLLKQQFPDIWVSQAVLFQNASSVTVCSSDCPWFTDVSSLISHIRTAGVPQPVEAVRDLLNRLICYDTVSSRGLFDRNFSCIVDPGSLNMTIGEKHISKSDIRAVDLDHHLTYDDITLTLRNGSTVRGRNEDSRILLRSNGMVRRQALSRIDHIDIGGADGVSTAPVRKPASAPQHLPGVRALFSFMHACVIVMTCAAAGIVGCLHDELLGFRIDLPESCWENLDTAEAVQIGDITAISYGTTDFHGMTVSFIQTAPDTIRLRLKNPSSYSFDVWWTKLSDSGFTVLAFDETGSAYSAVCREYGAHATFEAYTCDAEVILRFKGLSSPIDFVRIPNVYYKNTATVLDLGHDVPIDVYASQN